MDLRGETYFGCGNFTRRIGAIRKVPPLVPQLPWTHNLIILSQSKTPEEREFYLKTAIREKWSKRELERQFRGALFERTVLRAYTKIACAVDKQVLATYAFRII